MNIIMSLLIYNPIEALLLIMFCNIVTSRKFNKFDVLYLYVLGDINFAAQFIGILIRPVLLSMFYDIFATFVIYPISLYLFYNYIICKNENNRIKFSITLLALFLNFVVLSFTANTLNIFLNNGFNGVFNDIYNEFIYNLVARILYVILLKNINIRK